MNYVELAEKFAKEKTVKEEAVLNNKILGAKMQSKIKATEAAITEREVEVEIAEAGVEQAKAYLTRNVELWISGVRNAENILSDKKQDLEIAKEALKEYEGHAKLFPKK